jgi:2,5-furandicarboxylate decarboxylase 1
VAKNLQTFLEMLAGTHPALYHEVGGSIDPMNYEVSAYIKLLEDSGRLPTVLFSNVRDQNGDRSQFRLASNLFATRSLCAMALGLDGSKFRMELTRQFGKAQNSPLDYSVVQQSEAPVMQNVLTGEKVDLTTLPAARYHEKDAGPYLVMASVMKSRTGGFYDSTLTKQMIKGPRRLTITANPHHHQARMYAEYETANEKTPVAIVLGHHPAFYLGTGALTDWANEDYNTIGGFMGESLRVTPSAALGKDFLIPADAEIVIEGWMPPKVRDTMNPFGEISGHYQEERSVPVIEVEALCYRNKAIMEGMLPSHPEHFLLGAVAKEGSLFEAVKRGAPGAKAICMPNSSCGRFSCYISLQKRTYRDVQVAGMTAFAEVPDLKMVVVVDPEIDVFNENEVQWAVITQTRWDRDLAIIPRVQSIRPWFGDSVLIVDATKVKEGLAGIPERNVIPPSAIEEVKRRFGL